MAEDDAKKKKKGKMINFTTDHLQKEGSGDDDSVDQGDPGDSSTMKEDDANKEKMIGSTSDHLQKDGSDDSSTMALMNEGGPNDTKELRKAIISTPKKRKEPTTSETPSKIRIEEHWTPIKITTTAATVKYFHKINVKINVAAILNVSKKEIKSGEESSAAAGIHNSDSDSDVSTIMFIEGQPCSSPTSGLLPKNPPETDGMN
ncbi:hypothetical protein TSUD_103400 [Trifolium subterraneum]|uniref:Uncharacterized protein n=1 Tax=Trifolium subterraneum TaxID=3900 RepID=A0A2Z6NY28_TRISU|nr:hypothetical protein TSUD_103400 [Trifolium subterraneum]